MSEPIKLWRSSVDPKMFTEGDYADDGNGVAWRLEHLEGPICSPECANDLCDLAHPYECVSCDQWITERDCYARTDEGDGAHEVCVVIHSDYPHQTDTLHDCPACDMGEDHDW